MATSAATITVNAYPNGYDNTQRNLIVRGIISISAGTYPTGGYTMNWAIEGIKSLPTAVLAYVSPPVSLSPPSIFPIDVTFKSIASPPSGYTYMWDGSTGNLHVYNMASASPPVFQEITGTVTTQVTGDVIQFVATFTRN